jgi:hypothetical protein
MVDLRVGWMAVQMAVWWVGRTVVGRVALWVVLWVVQMAASTVV